MRNPPIVLILSLCTAVLASPSPVSAQGHIAEIGLRFWKPTPELVLSNGTLNGAGMNGVDLVQEFALGDERFREFRVSLGRSHKLRVAHVTFEYLADATIQRTFTYRGRTFTGGAPASTDVNWDIWTFGYEWDFVSRDAGFLGVVTNLHYNKVVASIDSPALSTAATTDVKAPIPTVGVIARGYLGSSGSITAEFNGLRITRDTFEGKFYDFDIYGTLHLGPNLGVQAGYRSVDVHYLVDDDVGDLKMKGPYFGGSLRF
jgi:hypothetical protein